MNEAERAARSYSAAMDSVNLINGTKPLGTSNVAWADIVKRNKEHLEIQLAKTEYYAGFDMEPIQSAVETT